MCGKFKVSPSAAFIVQICNKNITFRLRGEEKEEDRRRTKKPGTVKGGGVSIHIFVDM